MSARKRESDTDSEGGRSSLGADAKDSPPSRARPPPQWNRLSINENDNCNKSKWVGTVSQDRWLIALGRC